MIYLWHRYARSGLPEPSTVALFAEDVDWLKEQVRSEFACLFPDSQVTLDPADSADWTVELIVLAYRRPAYGLEEVIRWGRQQLPHASLGLGFYRIDRRYFEVVAVNGFCRWVWRQRLLDLLARWEQGDSRLRHLLARSACKFLW